MAVVCLWVIHPKEFMGSASTTRSAPREPGPAWDIARLFPDQGAWSEEDYLALQTNQLVEFVDGSIEVLPMPTTSHQLIVQCLSNLLLAFVSARGLGRVLFAPLRVQLGKNKYREPDVVFMLATHASRIGEGFWRGADLVMEVLSADPQDRKRDLVTKRTEYAKAGIAEYWIIDPPEHRITVLRLQAKRYVTFGEWTRTQQACSALLPEFQVDVESVFAAANP
jgi:Uma2 family endonuclease